MKAPISPHLKFLLIGGFVVYLVIILYVLLRSNTVLFLKQDYHSQLSKNRLMDQKIFTSNTSPSPFKGRSPNQFQYTGFNWSYKQPQGAYVQNFTTLEESTDQEQLQWIKNKQFVFLNTQRSLYKVDLNTAPPTILWKFSSTQQSDAGVFLGPPIITGRHVFIAAAPHIIYSLNQGTGSLNWYVHLTQKISSALLYWKGKLYFTITSNNRSRLIAIDAKTGQRLWQSPVIRAVNYPTLSFFKEQKAIILSSEKFIYSLSARKGQIRWKTGVDSAPLAAPLMIVQKRIYGINERGQAFALSASRGQKIWESTLKALPTSNLTFTPGLNRLTVTTDDGYLRTLRARTGQLIWKVPNHRKQLGLPIGRRYWSPRLFINRANDKAGTAWELNESKNYWLIWTPCSEKKLCVYSMQDGRLLSHWTLKGRPLTAPLFAGSKKTFWLPIKTPEAELKILQLSP